MMLNINFLVFLLLWKVPSIEVGYMFIGSMIFLLTSYVFQTVLAQAQCIAWGCSAILSALTYSQAFTNKNGVMIQMILASVATAFLGVLGFT